MNGTPGLTKARQDYLDRMAEAAALSCDAILFARFHVRLVVGPNSDFPAGDPRRDCPPAMVVLAGTTPAEAVAAMQTWLSHNDLGAGNLHQASLLGPRPTRRVLARVSFNGRLWDLADPGLELTPDQVSR